MARPIVVDLARGFPTLPGLDAHFGRIVQLPLGQNGCEVQVQSVHDGRERIVRVAVRDLLGRHAPDLVVRLESGRGARLASSAESVRIEDRSQIIRVSSKALGVDREVRLKFGKVARAAKRRTTVSSATTTKKPVSNNKAAGKVQVARKKARRR